MSFINSTKSIKFTNCTKNSDIYDTIITSTTLKMLIVQSKRYKGLKFTKFKTKQKQTL